MNYYGTALFIKSHTNKLMKGPVEDQVSHCQRQKLQIQRGDIEMK